MEIEESWIRPKADISSNEQRTGSMSRICVEKKERSSLLGAEEGRF